MLSLRISCVCVFLGALSELCWLCPVPLVSFITQIKYCLLAASHHPSLKARSTPLACFVLSNLLFRVLCTSFLPHKTHQRFRLFTGHNGMVLFMVSYFSFFFKIHCLAFVLLPSVNTKPLSTQLMLHLSQLFQWGVRELQIFRYSHMRRRTNPGASPGLATKGKVWAENEKEGVKNQACQGGQCCSAGSGGGRNKGSLLHGSLPQLGCSLSHCYQVWPPQTLLFFLKPWHSVPKGNKVFSWNDTLPCLKYMTCCRDIDMRSLKSNICYPFI